jgi:PAS domain S-box-containing protein
MSEYEQLVAEAEATRRQVTNILERISDAFVALDTEWRYTYVNAKAAHIFGRKREDLVGKHIGTEFPEGVGQPFYKACYKAVETQQPMYLEEYSPPYDC